MKVEKGPALSLPKGTAVAYRPRCETWTPFFKEDSRDETKQKRDDIGKRDARGYRDEDQEVELLAKVYKYATFSNAGKIHMDDSLVSDIFRIARKLGFGSLG
ncbi:MAG: hypothetical protein KJ042_09520 [Deltaproteobacteria bacterium]|nr:hypothetical protein [Deltaproteobacteria bacterium]